MLTSITTALAAPITVELPTWLYYLMALCFATSFATLVLRIVDRIEHPRNTKH